MPIPLARAIDTIEIAKRKIPGHVIRSTNCANASV